MSVQTPVRPPEIVVAPARAGRSGAAPSSRESAAGPPALRTANGAESAAPVRESRPIGASRARWAYAAVGIVCVGLGAAGAVLPGLPTTIFLIVASACFAKGCPWLEERLLRNRFFAPYMRYIDGAEPMPARARLVSIAMVVGASGASLVWLAWTERPGWLLGLVAAAAVVGVVCIARYRRG